MLTTIVKKVKLLFVKWRKKTGMFYGIYYHEGVPAKWLTKINDRYYFFNSKYEMVKGVEHFITKQTCNNLLKPGIYNIDEDGIITNPDDPRFPGGIPSQETLAQKLEIEHAKLKERQNKRYNKRSKHNNHYKLSDAQLKECGKYEDILRGAWVRKIEQEKLTDECKNYYKRHINKRDLVNYLRHRCSNYEVNLSLLNQMDNKEEYHKILKRSYITLISNVYNNLQATCKELIKELDEEA